VWKRLLLAFLIVLVVEYARGQTQNFTGGGGITITTVSALGSAHGQGKGSLAVVTDGNSTSDCTTGSSTTTVLCVYSGSSWAVFSSSGSGTVTGCSFTGGLISCSGSTTVASTVAGTSGGVPYFSSGTAWASSGALTQYGVLFGGGAAGAPTSSAQGAANMPLIGQGAANPIFSTIAYPTSLTSGGFLYASSTLAFASSALLATNTLPKSGGAGTAPLASSVIDNGTTVTSTDTGGYVAPVFVASGTTAGFADFPQGTTSAAVAPCNTATSICFQAPTSVTSQLRVFASAPATGFPLYTNSSGTMTETIAATSGTLSSGVGLLGTLALNAVLASTVANVAGHFTNLQVVTSLGGTCTTPVQFNVFDGTSNTGSTVTASATTQTKGTGTSTAQTQTFAAGDVIGIYISTAGATCVADQFTVTAQYSIP
jgi:hypothetical protein